MTQPLSSFSRTVGEKEDSTVFDFVSAISSAPITAILKMGAELSSELGHLETRISRKLRTTRRRLALNRYETDEVHQELCDSPHTPACTDQLGVAERSTLDDPIRAGQVSVYEERRAGEALGDAHVRRPRRPAVPPSYRGKSRCVIRGSTSSPVAVAPFGPARLYVVVPSLKPAPVHAVA